MQIDFPGPAGEESPEYNERPNFFVKSSRYRDLLKKVCSEILIAFSHKIYSLTIVITFFHFD